MVKPINYEFNSSVLYPFNYGVQHIKNAFSTQVVWRERIVHLAWGIPEMIPLINYIIAINGDPFLVFSQPTLRQSYQTTGNIPMQVIPYGNEVNMIFKDGSCITLFSNSRDIKSYISRMPEESPGLMDVLR